MIGFGCIFSKPYSNVWEMIWQLQIICKTWELAHSKVCIPFDAWLHLSVLGTSFQLAVLPHDATFGATEEANCCHINPKHDPDYDHFKAAYWAKWCLFISLAICPFLMCDVLRGIRATKCLVGRRGRT